MRRRVLLHQCLNPNMTRNFGHFVNCWITKIGIGTDSLILWYFCQEKKFLPQLYTQELLYFEKSQN